MQDIISPLFDEIRKTPDLEKSQKSEALDTWVSTTLVRALRLLVQLYSTFKVLLKIASDFLLDLLCFCMLQENDMLAKLGSACLQDYIENNAEDLEKDLWDSISVRLRELFEVTLPVQLFCSIDLEKGEEQIQAPFDLPLSPKPTRKDFHKIIIKCVLHLNIISTLQKVLLGSKKDLIMNSLHRKHIFILSDSLYKSFLFAKQFNECLRLRQFLLKIGFMKTLPNLVKQETTAAAGYLVLLSATYVDTGSKHQSISGEVEGHLLPLIYELLGQFCAFERNTQEANISAWEPVIVVILESFSRFPQQRFQDLHQYFYSYFVSILGMQRMTMLKPLSIIFDRIGEIHGIPKSDPPFATGFKPITSSHESLYNESVSENNNEKQESAEELVDLPDGQPSSQVHQENLDDVNDDCENDDQNDLAQ
jgi:brefeldin A-inhibited guanine nucleotide-exchange protein